MATKAEQILGVVDTRLKTIKTVNGYYTNLGLNVKTWDPTNQPGNADLLEYRDESYEPGSDMAEDVIGLQTHTMNLEIDITTAAGSATLETVRKMIADVLKAISAAGEDFGGLVDYLKYEGADIDADHKEKKIGGAQIRLAITYRTPQWEI